MSNDTKPNNDRLFAVLVAGSFAFLFGIPVYLTLVVCLIIHEFGHYFAANWRGVSILTLRVGAGPVLFSWLWKHTRFEIGSIPIWGWVRPYGATADRERNKKEADQHREQNPGVSDEFLSEQRWLCKRSPLEKIAFGAGGVFFNLMLATLLLFVTTASFGTRETSTLMTVSKTYPRTPLHEAGVRVGDQIVDVAGRAAFSKDQLVTALSYGIRRGTELGAMRDGKHVKLHLPKFSGHIFDTELDGKLEAFGVALTTPEIVHAPVSFLRVPVVAVSRLVSLMKQYAPATIQILIGRVYWQNVGGIDSRLEGGVTSDLTEASFAFEDILLAVVAFNVMLLLFNLIPLLPLDGGRIFFWFLELVGIRVSEKFYNTAALLGVALLFGTMLYSWFAL